MIAHDPPEHLDSAAYHGVVGEIVRRIEPHTESDPAAILAQSLVVFGAMVGRGAYYQVEATLHRTNEFVILVGPSGVGRKGTSLDQVLHVFRAADPTFSRQLASGLASGEGLVWRVRDEDPEAADPAPEDKRLLTIETEFAAVLKVARRADNTLSANLRNAWDGKTLETLSKNSPARATQAHISIIGHITRDELLRNVDTTETANGFLNRFIHVAVRSSKELPFGGAIDTVDFADVHDTLARALDHARSHARVDFAADAAEIWPETYRRLRAGRHGMLGNVTARGEAHVVRLALLYALLDTSPRITAAHLHAAVAVWRYAWAAARSIYGASLGDPVADELWAALRDRADGMTRTEIRDWFSRNRRRSDIERALAALSDAGLVRRQVETGSKGGSTERWIDIRHRAERLDSPVAGRAQS